MTVLLADEIEDPESELPLRSWTLAVKLRPLSGTEVEAYLTAKLAGPAVRKRSSRRGL